MHVVTTNIEQGIEVPHLPIKNNIGIICVAFFVGLNKISRTWSKL